MKTYVPLFAMALLGLMFAPAAFQARAQMGYVGSGWNTDSVTPQNLTGMLSQLPAMISQVGATFTSIVQAFTSQQGLSLLIRNVGRAAMVGLSSGLGSLMQITYYTIYAALIGFVFPIPLLTTICSSPILAVVAFFAALVAYGIVWLSNVLTALLQNY